MVRSVCALGHAGYWAGLDNSQHGLELHDVSPLWKTDKYDALWEL